MDRDMRSSRDRGLDIRSQMIGVDYEEKAFHEAKQRESWENQGSSLYDLHRPTVVMGGGGGGVHGPGIGHGREDMRHRPLSLPLSLSHGLGLGVGEDSMRHSLESKQSQSSDRPHSYSVYGHQRGVAGGGHHSDNNNSNSSSSNTLHNNMNNNNNSNSNAHNNAITSTPTAAHTSHVAPKDRCELVESPHSKLAYKDFYRHFRGMERESVEIARKYAEESLLWMPETARWRVLLELADLAKRGNDFEKVCGSIHAVYSPLHLECSRISYHYLCWLF